MLTKAMAVWVLGLLTLVPYGAWYLLFEASRDQYALLIVLVLFWIFGYWALLGPLLAAAKVRAVFRAIETARSRDDLLRTLQSPEARAVAIDLIAADNHIPRFLAERVHALLVRHVSQTPPPAAQNADRR
jgi:hypothetical protein